MADLCESGIVLAEPADRGRVWAWSIDSAGLGALLTAWGASGWRGRKIQENAKNCGIDG